MHARRVLSLLVVGSCLAASAEAARADVKLPPFFSDHMVLQRDGRAPIWGVAAPGEAVSVKFRDQEQKATADDKGNWRVELVKLKAGGPDELTVAGKNTLTLKDVLVGEVWVGSGQSNMAGNVGGYSKDDPTLAELATKDYPQIRGCNARGAWRVADAKTNPQFSAILFAFAVRLNKELDVPVGMMLGAVGGTPSGAWVSEAALAADGPSQVLMAKYAEEYPALMKKYEEVEVPRVTALIKKQMAEGKPVARIPPPPLKPGTALNLKPGYLYEPHIRPFVGYGIRGALWDQGESGTAVGGVDQYTMMGALIRGWRKEWGQGDFPFIYVQKPSGNGCAWDYENPVTNKAQPFSGLPAAVPADGLYVETHVKIMSYPNTGMAISSDLGPYTHPTNKSGYGARHDVRQAGRVLRPGLCLAYHIGQRSDREVHSHRTRPRHAPRHEAARVRRRGRRQEIPLGRCADRRRDGRAFEPDGEGAEGRALCVEQRADVGQSFQQRRLAGGDVSNGLLVTTTLLPWGEGARRADEGQCSI